MRKMKNYLKTGILLFGILFTLTNCEKENGVIDNPQTNQKEFIIKQFHFNDLISNSIFQKGFEKLNLKKSKSKNSNKASVDDIYNFIIDSTRIKEVVKDGYTSYTLLIKRPFKTPEYFENLVIEKRQNEIINAFIIKYTLRSQIKLFDEHHTFSFNATSNVTPLNFDNLNLASKSSSECMPIAQTWCSWSYPHVAGPSCFEANDGRLFTVFVEDENCTENGYPTSGGGGGSTTGSNPDRILTSPVDPDGNPVEFPVIPSANLINNLEGLNDAQIAWINDIDNAQNVIDLSNFLTLNPNSIEADNFAEEIINANINSDFSQLLTLEIFNQNPYKVWRTLSQKEKDLIKSFPYAAYNIFKNREIAENSTITKFGFNGLNDKSDAYRHAYYNAINTKKVGAYLAELFSNAHESEVPIVLLLEKEMDLFNNNVGQKSNINYPSSTIPELEDKIYQELLYGNLKYLSPLDFTLSPLYDSNGDEIQDCTTCKNGIISSTKLIPTNQ